MNARALPIPAFQEMQLLPDPAKSSQATGPSTGRIVATVLIPFGIGFYLSYLYRTMNAVIEPQLRLEFDLGASGIGFLTGVYFISFALVQIPLGVMVDRLGPRRVQIVLLVIAASGGAIFGLGDSFAWLTLGRILIGIGVAGGIVAVLSANALWFAPARQPLMNSIGVCFGGIGALSATVPMELALSIFTWRELFLGVSGFTLLLALFIWFVVPDRRAVRTGETSLFQELQASVATYRDPFFWKIGFLIIVGFACYISYQSLWAGPWLRDVAGFDRLDRANHLLLVQFGMFSGVLAGGFLADRIAPAGRALARFIAAGVGIFLLAQIGLIFQLTGLAMLLWFSFGFFGAVLFLCYSVYAQHYPPAMNGRVNTANNLIMFSLAFATQWGIGALIGLWPELPDQKYPAEAHMWAMILIFGFQLAGLIWFLWPDPASASDERTE